MTKCNNSEVKTPLTYFVTGIESVSYASARIVNKTINHTIITFRKGHTRRSDKLHTLGRVDRIRNDQPKLVGFRIFHIPRQIRLEVQNDIATEKANRSTNVSFVYLFCFTGVKPFCSQKT